MAERQGYRCESKSAHPGHDGARCDQEFGHKGLHTSHFGGVGSYMFWTEEQARHGRKLRVRLGRWLAR